MAEDARIEQMAMVRMLLTERVVAFHPVIAQITKDVKAALFLCQLMYWSDKGADTRGWIWKTRDQWIEETTLSRREQESARSKLRTLQLTEEALRGSPPKLYYRIKWNVLYRLLEARAKRYESAHSIGTKAPNQTAQNEPNERAESAHSIKETEITTETTAYIYTDTEYPWLGKLREIPGWGERGEPHIESLLAWTLHKEYTAEFLFDHAVGVTGQNAKGLRGAANLASKFQTACNRRYYMDRNGGSPRQPVTDGDRLERIRKAKSA